MTSGEYSRRTYEGRAILEAIGMREDEITTNVRLPQIVKAAADLGLIDPTTLLNPAEDEYGSGDFVLSISRKGRRMKSKPLGDRYLVDKMHWTGVDGVWSLLQKIRYEVGELGQ